MRHNPSCFCHHIERVLSAYFSEMTFSRFGISILLPRTMQRVPTNVIAHRGARQSQRRIPTSHRLPSVIAPRAFRIGWAWLLARDCAATFRLMRAVPRRSVTQVNPARADPH